jgi:hypothetical protein
MICAARLMAISRIDARFVDSCPIADGYRTHTGIVAITFGLA